MEILDLINLYGFPMVSAVGMAVFIYHVWMWVTKEIRPVITQANSTLISLINRIRMLDNDLIRLNQKVKTALELFRKSNDQGIVNTDVDMNISETIKKKQSSRRDII